MEPSAQERAEGYARGFMAIARAEGEAAAIADQVYRVATGIGSSEPLREALTDPRIPFERKQSIVGELLGGRAAPATVAMVNMVIAAGRARHLEDIAEHMVRLVAAQEDRQVAYVRSAVELDDATVAKLEERLSGMVGSRVEARVVVDPSVVAGLVARVGDTVFDGSLRSRLDELREAWV